MFNTSIQSKKKPRSNALPCIIYIIGLMPCLASCGNIDEHPNMLLLLDQLDRGPLNVHTDTIKHIEDIIENIIWNPNLDEAASLSYLHDKLFAHIGAPKYKNNLAVNQLKDVFGTTPRTGWTLLQVDRLFGDANNKTRDYLTLIYEDVLKEWLLTKEPNVALRIAHGVSSNVARDGAIHAVLQKLSGTNPLLAAQKSDEISDESFKASALMTAAIALANNTSVALYYAGEIKYSEMKEKALIAILTPWYASDRESVLRWYQDQFHRNDPLSFKTLPTVSAVISVITDHNPADAWKCATQIRNDMERNYALQAFLGRLAFKAPSDALGYYNIFIEKNPPDDLLLMSMIRNCQLIKWEMALDLINKIDLQQTKQEAYELLSRRLAYNYPAIAAAIAKKLVDPMSKDNVLSFIVLKCANNDLATARMIADSIEDSYSKTHAQLIIALADNSRKPDVTLSLANVTAQVSQQMYPMLTNIRLKAYCEALAVMTQRNRHVALILARKVTGDLERSAALLGVVKGWPDNDIDSVLPLLEEISHNNVRLRAHALVGRKIAANNIVRAHNCGKNYKGTDQELCAFYIGMAAYLLNKQMTLHLTEEEVDGPGVVARNPTTDATSDKKSGSRGFDEDGK